MATSNSTDDIKLENLKVEESTATAAATTKEKAAKPKKDKPKQEKPKVAAAAVVEAPAEELDFNRTAEEVEKALNQWSKQPLILNQSKPDEKM